MMPRLHRRAALGIVVATVGGLGAAWLLSKHNTFLGQKIKQVNKPVELGWEGGGVALCVGRFIVDVPRRAVVKSAKGASGTATFTAESPVALEDFRGRVQGRWDVIRQRVLDDFGKPRVKSPESIDITTHGVLFNFDHAVTRGPDVTGKVGEWSLHATEGHLWRDNVAYTFDESEEAEIRRTMLALQPLEPGRIPVGPGFCGPRAFIVGAARPEFVNMQAEWSEPVPMTVRVATSTYDDRMGLNALRLPKPTAATLPKDGRVRGHLIQEGAVKVGTMDGQEWIVGFTEQKAGDNYTTDVTATWFSDGAASSSDKPAVQIKLFATYRRASPPQPWGEFPPAADGAAAPVPRDEFMRAWRTVLASFRLRPGAL
jgi:Tle cognate immunity protein 4 C-terminal domain/Tle cognate immunity protein 4 N-terminal domain